MGCVPDNNAGIYEDPTSSAKRNRYVKGLLKDIYAREYIAKAKKQLGVDVSSGGGDGAAPQNPDEVSVYMQLNYKQNIELAQEEAINYTLDYNKYDLIRRRLNYDLTVLGIACSKTNFNLQEGVTVEYVDPANLVYSYTEDPNFEDIWYVGEVKGISMAELKKQFPHLTPSELEEIEKYPEIYIFFPQHKFVMKIASFSQRVIFPKIFLMCLYYSIFA